MKHFIGAAAATLLLLVPATAAAQVGHDPASSPYRDIFGKFILGVEGGYANGSGGDAGVGPASGPFGGVRLDINLSGPANAGFEALYASLDRRIIDPSLPAAEREVGTEKQSLVILMGGLGLHFTGHKTWHGLAPFIGASMGLAFGGDVPGDSVMGGFAYNTKFVVAPWAGIRWHLGRRLSLRIEARDMIWQLKYPNSFFEPPSLGESPVLNPVVKGTSEWTHNFWFIGVLGYTIS
ncbi:MAG: hypothetical protein JSW43_00610 [Gemmatimonadota bacterium]|nr:MAG: hypothetical protein JSW43_00610 [Gemmatimonadota bacterium]